MSLLLLTRHSRNVALKDKVEYTFTDQRVCQKKEVTLSPTIEGSHTIIFREKANLKLSEKF